MSSAVPQPGHQSETASQPAGRSAGGIGGLPTSAGPVRGAPVELAARGRSEGRSPYERLVALGVASSTARALVSEYGSGRVLDALDAVDTLGDGEVRRRAGWVVAAIRQGWDLADLLAERRTVEARYARWERERAARDREAGRWEARQAVAGRWRGAISSALDDRQLASAVERATSPMAGLGRRSVPVVAAQLLAWAVAAHRRNPDRPLDELLAADLDRPDRSSVPDRLEGPLPPPPAATDARDDLTARLTGLLARRPELARPGVPDREGSPEGRVRRVGEGVGHGR